MSWPESEEFEVDPYSAIRPALSPEHSSLTADEVTPALGGIPATLALHQALNSPEIRSAAAASLLGSGGRRSVRVNGTDVLVPSYLRMVSRLCREVAEQTEAEVPQEQQVGAPGASLGATVGRKGKNLPDDVKLVQRLLNSNFPLPAAPLTENGVLDVATTTAIEDYQRAALGQKTPDGRIDPKGQTFKSLTADKFAFLPHRCRLLTGSSADVDAARMNPGFLTSSGVTRNVPLQAIVERRVLLNNPKLRNMRFALVDLTGAEKLASPQFAGHDETVQGGLGSMSKMACMYAAYQLKFDLEELSRQRSLTTQTALFDAARTLWGDAQKPDPKKVSQLFASDPKIELVGKLIVVDGKPLVGLSGLSLPDLENLFTVAPASTGLTLRFKGSDKILVDPTVPGSPAVETAAVKAYIKGGGEALGQVRKLSFAERLYLMIDESDNAAAHSCIEKIGFLYNMSALWQSDFYRPERGGGLWEASTHDRGGSRWVKPPVPRKNPKTDFVSANACSIAALMTLIEQDRLVNRDACAAMKHLTDKQKSGVTGGSHTRSYFLEALGRLFTLDRIHSKLGIGEFLNDAAIIVRTVRPDPSDSTKDKQIRYVAAGFDDPTPATKPAVNLHALIVELDKCIREHNGLLSPTAP